MIKNSKVIERICVYFNKNEFIKNVFYLFSGNIVAYTITFASLPLITALYSPEDFGSFMVIFSVLNIVGVVSTLRYDVAINLLKGKRAALYMLGIVVYFSFFVSVVLLVGVCLLDVFFLQKLHITFDVYFLLMVITAWFIGCSQGFKYFLLREKNFQGLGYANALQLLLMVICQILLGFLAACDAHSLLVGFFLSNVISIIFLFRLTNEKDLLSFFFRKMAFKKAVYLIKRYKEFAFYSLPSSLFNNINLHSPAIIFLFLFDEAVSGYVALALRTVSGPLSLITTPLGMVFFRELIEIKGKNPQQIYDKTLHFLKNLFWFGLLPMGVVFFASPTLFPLVFGTEWSTAGIIASILVPFFFLQFIISPIGAILDVFERQDLYFKREFFRFILVLSYFVLFYFYEVDFISAVIAYMLFGCAGYLVFFYFSFLPVAFPLLRHPREIF
jgi:O-antigen/teichoic acid export membrane protein